MGKLKFQISDGSVQPPAFKQNSTHWFVFKITLSPNKLIICDDINIFRHRDLEIACFY